MIRKALKWEELFQPQFRNLVDKISQLFSIMSKRIEQIGLKLVYAEALSELINIINILLNSNPNWVLEGCDKYEFLMSISKLYTSFDDLFQTLDTMDFESINKPLKAKYDSTIVRDKSMMIKAPPKNESMRITQIVNDFKRSTLSSNPQKVNYFC